MTVIYIYGRNFKNILNKDVIVRSMGKLGKIKETSQVKLIIFIKCEDVV